MRHRQRWARLATAALLATTLVQTGALPAGAAPPAVAPEETALVRVQLPSEAMYDELVAAGADIATRPRADGSRVVVDLVLTGGDLAALQARGAQTVQVIQREGDGTARYRDSVRRAGVNAADTLVFLQAYWWTQGGRTFLQTQVATTATDDPDVEITVTWRTADGTTGSFALARFSDADEYQYHFQVPQLLPAQPVEVTATSSLGGTARPAVPALWPNAAPPPQPTGY